MDKINAKNLMFVLSTMIFIINSRAVKSSVLLSPNVTLSSGICPQVTFDCTAVDLPSTTLRWFINDDVIAAYPYDPNHQFPYNETLASSPWRDMVTILIVNASYSDATFDRANFYSTLTANLSAIKMFGGNNIRCGSLGTRNTTGIDFQYIAPPTRPLLECSLITSPESIIVSFDSFSSGNNVTNYHVVVTPTPSSCLSDQLVCPNENYNCSGLVLETLYSYTVSAINCGNQEGAESTITVHPQVPLIPEIVLIPMYIEENSLSQLTVTWQVKHLSLSDVCSFDNSLNYSIFLDDSGGGRLEERVVNSDSCNNNLCSTSFTTSSSNQSYLVSIYAVNAFGQSNSADSISIGNSLQSEVLSLALTFEECVTTLLCSSILAEGPCVIQYGQDSSYENFDNHLNVSLNSPSPLPLMHASTQYYFQVEVRVNSTFYRSRRSFMTEEFATHLTDTNIGLLIVGVMFLILGIIIVIVWIPLFIKSNTASTKRVWIASLVLLLVAVFLWLVSLCLWIAVGGVVGPQKNTCDSKWQSNRDNLIIAAFILSFISLLFVAVILVAICNEVKQAQKRDKMDQQPIKDDFGHNEPNKKKASECQQCQSELSFFWNPHHYCDACGKSYCSLCTTNKAELPYSKNFFFQKRRVCDTCYEECKKKGIAVCGPGVRPPCQFYQPASSQPASVTSTQHSSSKTGSTTKPDPPNLSTNGPSGTSDNQDGANEQKPDDEVRHSKPSEEKANKCQQCGSEFSIVPWKLNEFYRCSACSKCFCSVCTVFKADLKMKQRVCHSCCKERIEKGMKVYHPSQQDPVSTLADFESLKLTPQNDSTTKSQTVCEKCKTHFQCSENNMMLCPHCHQKKGDLHMESREGTNV